MNEIRDPDDLERFRRDAGKYSAYLETPEGRLRLDLAFANLQEFLPQKTPLQALDLGGGTGATAVRLAKLGHHVALLDASQEMLKLAERAAREAGVEERIALKHGDAGQLAKLFPAGSFDLVLCHNLLEFVDDPCAVLRDAARLLQGSLGILSVLSRTQPGEVLKAALVNADLVEAERNLTAEWADESLYGGRVRLFSAASLKATMVAASLAVIAERGVRVFSDYLPPRISRTEQYQRIFELERRLGSRPEFAAIARYTHCIAQGSPPVVKDGA